MVVAGAEDDGLLERVAVAGGKQALEQVGAHGLDAVGHDQALVDGGAFGAGGDIVGGDGGPVRALVSSLPARSSREDAAHALRLLLPVVVEVPLLDVHGGEVAVFDALEVGVFVNGLAEVAVVVGQAAALFLDGLAGRLRRRLRAGRVRAGAAWR